MFCRVHTTKTFDFLVMSSKQEMLKLASQLQSMAMGGGNKKKNKPNKPKSSNSLPGPSGNIVAPNQRPITSRNRPRNRPRNGARNDGSIRISRVVKIGEVKADDKGSFTKAFPCNLRNFTWISKIANAYERVKFHKLGFTYRACVGTNSTGLIAMGFDYDSNASAPTDRDNVTCLEPFVEVPIWGSPSTMMLPQNKLNAVNWYIMDSTDPVLKSPGSLLVAVTSDKKSITIGDIFCTYDVTFMGPQA